MHTYRYIFLLSFHNSLPPHTSIRPPTSPATQTWSQLLPWMEKRQEASALVSWQRLFGEKEGLQVERKRKGISSQDQPACKSNGVGGGHQLSPGTWLVLHRERMEVMLLNSVPSSHSSPNSETTSFVVALWTRDSIWLTSWVWNLQCRPSLFLLPLNLIQYSNSVSFSPSSKKCWFTQSWFLCPLRNYKEKVDSGGGLRMILLRKLSGFPTHTCFHQFGQKVWQILKEWNDQKALFPQDSNKSNSIKFLTGRCLTFLINRYPARRQQKTNSTKRAIGSVLSNHFSTFRALCCTFPLKKKRERETMQRGEKKKRKLEVTAKTDQFHQKCTTVLFSLPWKLCSSLHPSKLHCPDRFYLPTKNTEWRY